MCFDRREVAKVDLRIFRDKSLITYKEYTLLNAYLLTFINELKDGANND